MLLLAFLACLHRTDLLDGVIVQLDGGPPVWPPSGEGCEAVVACCRALADDDRHLGLVCQLAAAHGETCDEMWSSTRSIYAGRHPTRDLPESCAAP